MKNETPDNPKLYTLILDITDSVANGDPPEVTEKLIDEYTTLVVEKNNGILTYEYTKEQITNIVDKLRCNLMKIGMIDNNAM